jgi:RNA recognition motif-containing protein
MHAVCVSRLSSDTTKLDIRALFEYHGLVVYSVDLTAKGTALVKLPSEEDAEYACANLDGERLNGRRIRVTDVCSLLTRFLL